MKTDELVRALAADLADSPPSLAARLAAAIPAGVLVAAAIFALTLGPRPDFMAVAGDTRFLFKFVIALLLAAASGMLVLRMMRPAAPIRLRALALAAVPLVLLLVVVAELMALPPSQWIVKLVGANAAVCLMSIPLFAAPILATALMALRAGAPMRPGLAGMVAGLLAGGLGAALYAAHCPDDSPLFLATWYSLAIAIVMVIGAVGHRILRW